MLQVSEDFRVEQKLRQKGEKLFDDLLIFVRFFTHNAVHNPKKSLI